MASQDIMVSCMFVPSSSRDEPDPNNDERVGILSSIEALIFSFLDQLNSSLEPNSPASGADSKHDANRTPKNAGIRLEFSNRKSKGVRTLIYPRKSQTSSSRSLAQVIGVLNVLHEALSRGYTTTKRDIYYKDVALFKSQTTVDRIVDDIAATFEAERSMMNVRATSKGLLLGSGVEIHLASYNVISSNTSEGILIPPGEAIERFDITEMPTWILLVEKEAIFQVLCQSQFSCDPLLPGRGLVITGKGYPDIATRELLKTFAHNLPDSVPILALVDGDPHGLDILSVYKFGSASMRHEADKLAASRVEPIGIWGSELADLGVGLSQLIPITIQDEAKALSMLQRQGGMMPSKWRKELARMLHLRRKAEIEILTIPMDGLSGQWDPSLLLHYLRRKIAYFVDLYTDV